MLAGHEFFGAEGVISGLVARVKQLRVAWSGVRRSIQVTTGSRLRILTKL